MSYVIQMITPEGIIEYIPVNFGFGVHKHAKEMSEAARFETKESAERKLQAYINPSSFWNSEREYAQKQREKFKDWNCSIIEI